ncbi:MAG: hypothetical protein AMXMBFR12_10050 [Candidatus Babeliales bacterium]
MMICKIALIAIIPLFICCDSEFILEKKPAVAKQPKVTVEDCIQEILEGQKIVARQMQYMGQIQMIELQWGQDCMDDTGILKKAKPVQLQELMAHKKKTNQTRLEYEKALKQERDFLKQFEKTVLAPVKKY